MRFTASAFLGLALLLFSNASWGQDWENEASSYFVLEEVLMRGSDDPTLRSPLAVPQPKLILETTKDGKTVIKARIGMEMQKKYILDLQVASPTNQSGDTTLATLDGLSNGTSAEVGFSRVIWREGEARSMLNNVLESDDARQGNDARESNDVREGDDADEPSLMELYSRPELSTRPSAVAVLGSTHYKSAVKASRDHLKSYTPFFLTARAKVGQQEFHFVDEETLRPGDQTHSGHELTASVGAYLRGRFYTSLSYRGGREFAAGRKANLCSPFEGTNSLECRDLVVGMPKERKTEDLEFEVRRLFGTLGFAARLSRDLQEKVTFVEVPIYFLQKLGASEMEMNGGVAIKWQSDTDDYSLSVFIGPALSTVFRMAGLGDR